MFTKILFQTLFYSLRKPQQIMKRIFVLLFVSLIGYQVSAQIVNIEKKRRKNLQDTSGIFGQIDLGFNIVNNTKQIISTNAAANLTWRKNKTTLISITDFGFVSAGGDRFVNRGFQHLRYNYELNDRITWEVFYPSTIQRTNQNKMERISRYRSKV